jgi:hypothetical protein
MKKREGMVAMVAFSFFLHFTKRKFAPVGKHSRIEPRKLCKEGENTSRKITPVSSLCFTKYLFFLSPRCFFPKYVCCLISVAMTRIELQEV